MPHMGQDNLAKTVLTSFRQNSPNFEDIVFHFARFYDMLIFGRFVERPVQGFGDVDRDAILDGQLLGKRRYG